ncbi:zinc-binding protein A33-like [Osmerus eperlanus]|uniref:zinc-binding protein A33-like n=1 Tax=Osmerus eperlanus TaxID=29151 RepID=UPI002E151AF3
MAAASSTLTDHLLCSICTEVYTDPVFLTCQHTFCMRCIQQCLDAGHQHCPECRQPVRDRNFQINRLIKNIADQLRLEENKKGRGGVEREDVCPEHGESLKLFCETDDQLICHICRDGREHRGHTFIPLKEAQEDLRGKLVSVIFGSSEKDIDKASKAIHDQEQVLSDQRHRCDDIQSKIKAQFEEVIAKLREKEEKAMREIEFNRCPAEMGEHLTKLERYLATARERKNTLQSGLEITDPREFLRWWREEGSALYNTSPKWPQVHRSKICSLTKQDDIDYDNMMGCILWENIDKILRWHLSTVKQHRCCIA